jgi:hypothetical protein
MKAEADSMPAPAAVDESTEAAKPEESLDGPHRTVTGTIKNVRCLPPAVLDLDVVADGGKTVALHSGNYYRLQFIALGFAPDSDLRPCSDLEGMHAKVEYVESKSIESKAGGLTSIELHK